MIELEQHHDLAEMVQLVDEGLAALALVVAVETGRDSGVSFRIRQARHEVRRVRRDLAERLQREHGFAGDEVAHLYPDPGLSPGEV